MLTLEVSKEFLLHNRISVNCFDQISGSQQLGRLLLSEESLSLQRTDRALGETSSSLLAVVPPKIVRMRT